MQITKKKNKWVLDYYFQKKRKRKTFNTKKDAELFYFSIKNNVNETSSANTTTEIKSENLLLELIQTYKNYKFSSISSATQKKINAIFEIFKEYIFSIYTDKVQITAITPKMIIDFISGQSKQFAPKTVNNRIIYIRELFKFAVDMRIIKESPVIVKFVKEEKALPEYYSPEEIQSMLAAARNKMSYYVIINLLLYTGIRMKGIKIIEYMKK